MAVNVAPPEAHPLVTPTAGELAVAANQLGLASPVVYVGTPEFGPTRNMLIVWATVTLEACALSPDEILPPIAPGRDLAYASFGIAGNYDLFRLSANASIDTNLTLTSAYDFWPSWSPDGSQFVFESNRSDSM